MHSPLEQFEIKKIAQIDLAGFDVSFTNSSLFTACAVFSLVFFGFFSLRKKLLIPSRFQAAGELLYFFVSDTAEGAIGSKGRRFVPLVFSLFAFILFANLTGMLPYCFTTTSHVSLTFFLASIVFFAVVFTGIVKHGFKFFSLFLPEGTPIWMAPLMVAIELFSFLARPVTLSLRLTANMVAGHVLLKIVLGFIISISLFLKFLPLAFAIIIIGFEIFVAVLQAYIFSVLTCVYLSDAVNLH